MKFHRCRSSNPPFANASHPHADDFLRDPRLPAGTEESADAVSSATFRQQRRDNLIVEVATAAKLHDLIQRYNLQAETAPLSNFEAMKDRLNAMEDEAESLTDRHTPEAAIQVYTLLHDQILSADAALFDSLIPFVVSEEVLRDSEVQRLGVANRSVAITLWSSTLLGAVLVAIFSFVLGRNITRGIRLVAERANAIACGDRRRACRTRASGRP